MTIKHSFTSFKTDGADTTVVRPSNWNDDHVIGDGTATINASSGNLTIALSPGPTITANPNLYIDGLPVGLELIDVAALQAASIPSDVDRLHVQFYSSSKQSAGGGAWYRRYTNSSDPGTVAAADGSFWIIDEPVISVTMLGAVPDGVTDCATAFDVAATLYNSGRDIFMPTGTYLKTRTTTLTSVAGARWYGESIWNTIVLTSGAGAHGFTITATGAGYSRGISLSGFTIAGNDATTGNGIHSDAGLFACNWYDLVIYGQGGHGIYLSDAFSMNFINILASSSGDGHCFCVNGGPATTFTSCYAQSGSGTLRAGYRIVSNANLIGCNGVDSGLAYWGVFGALASVSSTAQAGGANTITLNAGDTFANNMPNGLDIVLTSGTGSGQTRRIIAYDSTTKIATVDSNWAVNPAVGTGYTIQDSVVFARSATRGIVRVIGCNVEAWNKDGIRFLGYVRAAIEGGSFINNGTFDCFVHLPAYLATNHVQLGGIEFNGTASIAEIVADDFIGSQIRLDGFLFPIVSYYDAKAAITRPIAAYGAASSDFVAISDFTLANGAGGSTATLTNGPSAGNPTKWIGVDDNGTTRWVPSW